MCSIKYIKINLAQSMGNDLARGEKAYKIKLDEANKLGEGSFATVYKIKRSKDK
jgi:hypothetical protein